MSVVSIIIIQLLTAVFVKCNYIFNETVQVSSDSSETARVKVWDSDSSTLDVSMLTKMQFQVGEKIKGLESGAEYVLLAVSYDQPTD